MWLSIIRSKWESALPTEINNPATQSGSADPSSALFLPAVPGSTTGASQPKMKSVPNRVFQQTQRSVGNHSLRLELSFSSVLHFTGNRCEIARQFERVVAWRESLKYKHTVKPNGLRKSVAWEVT